MNGKSIGEAQEVNVCAHDGGKHELIRRGGMLRPREAVSCTGALLKPGNPNHSHRCGKDEPGEGFA